MLKSIDEIIDFCEAQLSLAQQDYERCRDEGSWTEINCYEDLLDRIRSPRVVKSPSVQGALSPERIREACKKVNQRRDK